MNVCLPLYRVKWVDGRGNELIVNAAAPDAEHAIAQSRSLAMAAQAIRGLAEICASPLMAEYRKARLEPGTSVVAEVQLVERALLIAMPPATCTKCGALTKAKCQSCGTEVPA